MKQIRLLIIAILILGATFVLGQTTRILSFRASRHSIRKGDTVTLTWATAGTRSVTIEWRPLVGDNRMTGQQTNLPPIGTFDDHPHVSTIYVLECAAESGVLCAASSVTVYVK